ncbi:MAG: hypothetical protein WBN57_03795 [Gammaproteobacteria bacterium]
MKLIVVAIFLYGMTTAVAASSAPKNDSRLKWFAGFGLTHGGDELAEVKLYYDDDSHDEDLRGGELITIAAGIVFYLPQPSWSLQTSIGYHTDAVGDYNDDITFDRYPLELIPFYNFSNHRIGAGLSYHLSPELDLKEIGGPKVEFDDALGWLVEYDYSFSGWENDGVVLGVRYLWIDYEVDKVNKVGTPGIDVDGNHVGIHVNYMF